jgi:hypothetical protein
MKTFQFLSAILLTLCIQSVSAQSAFEKGQQNLHLGIGLGSTLYGSGYRGVIPPVSISYEKAIRENIGVGGYLAYASSRYNYSGYDYHWRYSYTILGVRGAYHFNELITPNPKLDVYAGAMLGFNIARARFHSDDPLVDENLYDSPAAGGFTWSFYAGGRYQLKEEIGVFAELGYGIAWLQLGANMKF